MGRAGSSEGLQRCQRLAPYARAWKPPSHGSRANVTRSSSRTDREVTYPSLPEKCTRTLEMRVLQSEASMVGFPSASLPSLRLILI